MSGTRWGIFTVSWGMTTIILPYTGQGWGDTSLMWVVTVQLEGLLETANSLREPSLITSHWDRLYIARTWLKFKRSTCQGQECMQPMLSTGWRHHPRLLWASHVGSTSQQFSTPNLGDSQALWANAGGGVQCQAKSQCQRSQAELIIEFQDIFTI